MDTTGISGLTALKVTAVVIVICVVAVSQVVREHRFSKRERLAWVAVILLVPVLGPVGWFIFGRKRAARLGSA